MIEKYPTGVIHGQRGESGKESGEKERGKKKGESEGTDGRQDHRHVVKPVVLFPPRGPLCLSALDFRLSHFPLSLRISSPPLSPFQPPRLSRPPFLFVFRGDRGPETDVRAVKNGRRCASGTGTTPLILLAVPWPKSYPTPSSQASST